MGTQSPFNELGKAVKSGNIPVIGSALGTIITEQPDTWLYQICQKRILPDIDDARFSGIISLLLQGIQTIRSEQSYLKAAIQLITHLIELAKIFDSIRLKLESLSLWQEGDPNVIYRFSALIEDQSYQGEKNLQREIAGKGYYDPVKMGVGEKIIEHSGIRYNTVQNYEQKCESFQLILSYCLKRGYFQQKVKYQDLKTPYEDKEFAILLGLANLWRIYRALWMDIKYCNWEIERLDEEKVYVIQPSDIIEHALYDTGGLRHERIKAELGIMIGLIADAQNFSDSPQLLQNLAKSISLPETGSLWNGEINISLLSSISNYPRYRFQSDMLLEKFNFKDLANDLNLGLDKQVSWRELNDSVTVLRIFAEAVQLAVKGKSLSGHDVLRQVIRVQKDQLATIIHKATSTSKEKCLDIVNLLTFNPKFLNLEIWDTPLIPLPEEENVIFVPNLLINGSDSRAFENFASQFSPDIFDLRGRLLEKELCDIFRKQAIPAQNSIKIKVGKEEHEFDVVVWWDDFLFLIETKCTKSTYNGLDKKRAWDHVQNSIEQLWKRHDFVLTHWKEFRSVINRISLPENVPDEDHIGLITVMNITGFSGIVARDVVVTDEHIVRRFFEDPEIAQYENDRKVKVLGRIRKSNRPKAIEFFKYLVNPPQIRAIMEYLSPRIEGLPYIDEENPRFAFHTTIFEPDDASKRSDGVAITAKEDRKKRKRHK